MKNITIVIIALLLFVGEVAFAQQAKKIVLLEQFTNTLCPSCGYRNPELYDMILTKYDTEIIHIAYHNNRPLPPDPFYQANPEPANIRTDYYEITASPSIVVNGDKQAAAKPLLTAEQLEKQLNQTNPLHLTIEEKIQPDKERQLQISAKTSAALPNANYKLFVAVIEKDIFFCTYFEYIFDNVFRTFLSDDLGDDISLSNNEKNYTYQYKPNTDWNEEQLFVVAFVQNIETKEIINASATKPLNTNKTTRFANDDFSLLSTIADDVCGENAGAIEIDICVDTAPMEDPVNLSFTWSNGATTQNIYNLPAGNYAVNITNNILQTSTEQFYEIKGNEQIKVAVNTQADTGTNNGSIQVQATGGSGNLLINWNNGEATFNVENLQSGVYAFTITDENGCAVQQSVEVKSELVINIGEAVVEVQSVSCAGKSDGSVNINSSGDVPIHKIIWLLADKTGDELTGLAAGDYTFFTLDEAGNQMHEGSFTIEEPAPIELVIQRANGFEEPYINIESVLGGTPPYQYSWSNSATTPLIDNIEFGEYSVKVTDVNKCLQMETITIKQNTYHIQQISCHGANDGAIEIRIHDGLTYNFNWTNGENESNIKNLSAGRHGLTVSNDVSSHFLSFDITEPFPLMLSLRYDSLTTSIQPAISGGTPPYQFLWNTGLTQPVLENPENERYVLSLRDNNGCINEAAIEVKVLSSIYNTSTRNLTVYPNPVKSFAYINLPVSFRHANNIELYNAKGAKQYLPKSIANNQLQINVAHLSNGVYFLQIEQNRLTYIAKTLVWR